jgi:hypothetical protein
MKGINCTHAPSKPTEPTLVSAIIVLVHDGMVLFTSRMKSGNPAPPQDLSLVGHGQCSR